MKRLILVFFVLCFASSYSQTERPSRYFIHVANSGQGRASYFDTVQPTYGNGNTFRPIAVNSTAPVIVAEQPDTVIIDSVTGTSTTYNTMYAARQVGQSFKPTNTVTKVISVQFEYRCGATGTEGKTFARIYAHNTAAFYGTEDGIPDGDPLAVSDSVAVVKSQAQGRHTFHFAGANQISLTKDTPYYVVLCLTASNTVYVYPYYMPNAHPGCEANDIGGWGFSDPAKDMIFNLKGIE